MKLPVNGRISSGFGNRIHPITGKTSFHNGIDIAARLGTPIYAPASGTVVRTWWDRAGGRCMWIQHDGGIKTGYAHCQWVITPGEIVNAGDIIGTVIDAHGSPIDHPINEKVIGIGIPDLARIPNVILAAGGTHKIPVCRAILGLGLVNTFVTEEATARALVAP